MNNRFRKTVALISSISILSVSTVSNVFAIDTIEDYTQFPFVRECEDAEIANGNETWTSIYEKELPGYSGDGFIYLTGNSIKFEVNVPEDDMYEVKVRYAQILSEDGRMQTISINGTDYMVDFPYSETWKDISMGMFRLKAGVNTIEIKPQYGYASYDTITVDKANFPSLDVEPTLSDKDATPETQSLMNYLCDVYGKGIISGQQEIYGGGNDGDTELEFDFIEELTGELPAIRGFDFMNYNPLYGWDDNTTERAIEWVTKRNGIATGCWHINVPLDFENYEPGEPVDWTECTYTEKSDFDTSKAVIEGTKEHEYVMMAIEDLAEQLLRLQEANVPIIFRPFHEAEGNGGINGEGAWFWWSKSGAEVYKELWKMLYNTLTEDYGLHNIIWEFNSYDYSTSYAWYPGDDYVDIVGYDKYNTVYNRHDGLSSGPNVDAISSTFYSLVNLTNAKKLVAMPENDTIPTIENMEIEQARWLYFCPWYGEHILDSSKNDPETLKSIYQNDYCVNLSDLPENLYSYKSGDIPDKPPVTTTKPTEIEPSVTTTSIVEEPVVHSYYGTVKDINGTELMIKYIDQETIFTIDTDDKSCTVVGEPKVGSFVRVEYNESYTKCIVTVVDEFSFPVVLNGTVTDISDDGTTVKFNSGITHIFANFPSAKVDDKVIVYNMSDVIDDDWFETATIIVQDGNPSITTSNNSSIGGTLLGDANVDGDVRNNDVQLIRQYILHLSQPFEEGSQGFINSDVNKDGSIRNNDVQLIRQYILHIIDSLDNISTSTPSITDATTTILNDNSIID